MFDGRIAEDFKLVTGTWVTVGRLRAGLVSEAGGLLSDAVITGHDRAHAGALAWVNPLDARRAFGENVALIDPRLRERITDALRRLNAGAGSASRIERLLLLDEPPDLDAGEITDKGYVNQRRVLERRADAVAHLYVDPPAPDVIASPR
jgi:feruloyl-CoA synthase